jgi:transcriptional regulator of acetoin/glycerol metabolism
VEVDGLGEMWADFIKRSSLPQEVSSVIIKSWQRCWERQLSFEKVVKNEILTSSQLRERLDTQDRLMNAANNALPFLERYLKGKRYIILLCDRDGYILKAAGDLSFLTKAQTVHLSAGATWREDVKGTNAIGTSLEERRPVQVIGWEHYVRENHFLNCWATPICDTNGELIGVLDISGETGGKDDRLMEIVIMGGKIIEQNLQVLELQNNFRFCQEGIKMAGEMLREGFVTINRHGEISNINETGSWLLGKKREEVIGRPASEVFRSGKGLLIRENKHSLSLQVDNPGLTINSRFSHVTDEHGSFLGTVGVLQPGGLQKERSETFWIGRSELTRKVFAHAAKAAMTLSTVLILGESGTGKEVLARYIHSISDRKKGPFVAINCAAIPATLIESELFGYAEGSFTGAKKGGQPGKFEQAQDGTIFFDEIGDMPLHIQASLLRVLQEREVYRLGDTKTRKVNARIVAATNKELKTLMDAGKFRLDLYYRLKVVTLVLPPLRHRKEDIFDLAPYFVVKASSTQCKRPPAVSDEVYARLLAYDWPGNIRELENCVESMVAMSDGVLLTEEDLPGEIRGTVREEVQDEPVLDRQTRQAILQVLSQTGGKIAPTARILGIGRTTLYRKLREYNIRV